LGGKVGLLLEPEAQERRVRLGPGDGIDEVLRGHLPCLEHSLAPAKS
jgi:hypothetical protein